MSLEKYLLVPYTQKSRHLYGKPQLPIPRNIADRQFSFHSRLSSKSIGRLKNLSKVIIVLQSIHKKCDHENESVETLECTRPNYKLQVSLEHELKECFYEVFPLRALFYLINKAG